MAAQPRTRSERGPTAGPETAGTISERPIPVAHHDTPATGSPRRLVPVIGSDAFGGKEEPKSPLVGGARRTTAGDRKPAAPCKAQAGCQTAPAARGPCVGGGLSAPRLPQECSSGKPSTGGFSDPPHLQAISEEMNGGEAPGRSAETRMAHGPDRTIPMRTHNPDPVWGVVRPPVRQQRIPISPPTPGRKPGRMPMAGAACAVHFSTSGWTRAIRAGGTGC